MSLELWYIENQYCVTNSDTHWCYHIVLGTFAFYCFIFWSFMTTKRGSAFKRSVGVPYAWSVSFTRAKIVPKFAYNILWGQLLRKCP